MTQYMMISEHDRLEADIADLDTKLQSVTRGPGLKARSVRSFLAELRRHKHGMLKDLDQRLAETGSAVN